METTRLAAARRLFAVLSIAALALTSACGGPKDDEPGGPVCGNGTVESAEACDDGNETAGDGCENDCTVTPLPDGDDDGIADASDVCPGTPDPAQTDADADGKGDACDPCRLASNPGSAGCPATIYDVKGGTYPLGSAVVLTHQLVTAKGSNGFFIQVKPADAGFVAAENSGLFVFSAAAVFAGDRVDVAGTIDEYFGRTELTASSVQPVSSGEVPPDPVPATAAEVATGGARAAALEAVLVQVADATVTDVAPALGAGDRAPSNEFVVDGSLRVDDLLHLASPFPTVGTPYASIAGVLTWIYGDSVLEPRAAADLVP